MEAKAKHVLEVVAKLVDEHTKVLAERGTLTYKVWIVKIS